MINEGFLSIANFDNNQALFNIPLIVNHILLTIIFSIASLSKHEMPY